MLFARPWTSLCLLAGSLVGVRALGLSEHPDIKAISVSLGGLGDFGDILLMRSSYGRTASSP